MMICPGCGKKIEKPRALIWHKCQYCGILMQNGIRKTQEEKQQYHKNEQITHLEIISKKIEQHIYVEPEKMEKYKKDIPEIKYFLYCQQTKTKNLMEALKTIRNMLTTRNECLDIADMIFKMIQNIDQIEIKKEGE